MRFKKADLKWNVLYYEANSNEITICNALAGVAEELQIKIRKKEVYNKETLRDFLNRYFMYHYWCKSEYEILVSGLLNRSEKKKIDIYSQLEMNIDRIIEYINIECNLKY